MARSTPDPPVLVEASTHLLYEIQMLCHLANYFEDGELDRAVASLPMDGLPARNASVEAFGVHARQLIDFLTGTNWERDVFASDYAPRWTSDEKRWTQIRRQVNQYIAHLGLDRASSRPTDRHMFTSKTRGDLAGELLRFVDAADASLLEPGFKARARLALTAHEQQPLATITPVGAMRITSVPNVAGTATQGLPPS